MKDLLCTTDLTAASDTALRHALVLADRLGLGVSLLHVLMKSERSDDERQEVMDAIDAQIERTGGTGRVKVLLPEGDLMEGIGTESGRGHKLVVMGTHGAHGLRQSLFGADILKLVRRSEVPSFVVQEQSPVQQSMKHIVMPVAGHPDVGRLIDTVCALARAFAAEVHVFQLVRPHEEPSEELMKNKAAMLTSLQQDGIRHVEANVPSTGFSVGFAASTIEYAKQLGAGCIAIMAHASEEYRYIADAEKERILMNDASIPVLCA